MEFVETSLPGLAAQAWVFVGLEVWKGGAIQKKSKTPHKGRGEQDALEGFSYLLMVFHGKGCFFSQQINEGTPCHTFLISSSCVD